MTCLVAERQHIHIFLTGVQKLAIREFPVATPSVFTFFINPPASGEQIVLNIHRHTLGTRPAGDLHEPPETETPSSTQMASATPGAKRLHSG